MPEAEEGLTVETRSLPVPDGLAGERVDAALAKLLGLLAHVRRRVVEAGGVHVDGVRLASPTGCPPAAGSRSLGRRGRHP